MDDPYQMNQNDGSVMQLLDNCLTPYCCCHDGRNCMNGGTESTQRQHLEPNNGTGTYVGSLVPAGNCGVQPLCQPNSMQFDGEFDSEFERLLTTPSTLLPVYWPGPQGLFLEHTLQESANPVNVVPTTCTTSTVSNSTFSSDGQSLLDQFYLTTDQSIPDDRPIASAGQLGSDGNNGSAYSYQGLAQSTLGGAGNTCEGRLSSVNQVQIGCESSFWNFPDYIPNSSTPSNDLPQTCVPPGRECLQSTSPWPPFPLMEPPRLSNGSNLLSSFRNGISSGIENEMPYSFKNTPSRFQLSIPERDHQTLTSNAHKEASSFCLVRAAASASDKNDFPKGPRKRKIPGRRSGPFKPGDAKKVARIRVRGACWSCKLTNSPCSEPLPCDICRRRSIRSGVNVLCNTLRLPQFASKFFPNCVTIRYCSSTINAIINERIRVFTDNRIESSITSGSSYETISLTVYEYLPADQNLSEFRTVKKDPGTQMHTTESSLALPIALDEQGLGGLEEKILPNINSIIQNPRNTGEATSRPVSEMTLEVINAIYHFGTETEKDPLIMQASRLHAGYYILDTVIMLTEDSATRALESLRSPVLLPHGSARTSPVINLQMKNVLQDLLWCWTNEVFKGMEALLVRPVTEVSWARAFCVLVLLTASTEIVQMMEDGSMIDPEAKERFDISDRITAYRELETMFDDLLQRFHRVFGSHKRKGVNPIRDRGVKLNQEKCVTQEMVDLVDTILEIIREYDKDMENHAKPFSFSSDPNLNDHMEDRPKMVGRELSRLLLSFIWKT